MNMQDQLLITVDHLRARRVYKERVTRLREHWIPMFEAIAERYDAYSMAEAAMTHAGGLRGYSRWVFPLMQGPTSDVADAEARLAVAEMAEGPYPITQTEAIQLWHLEQGHDETHSANAYHRAKQIAERDPLPIPPPEPLPKPAGWFVLDEPVRRRSIWDSIFGTKP